jgi:lipid II:glycine glycyltransferase (peptidoglycan interpeptide bridge formation enzyme)
MDFIITDTLDKTVWRDFVDQHPQGNIFQTPEMFEVFSRASGYQPELRAAIGTDGQVLALLVPVQVSLKNGLLRRLTTRSIAYGSTLCTPDAAGKEALKALLSDYTKKAGRDGLFTELRHLSDLSVYQPIFTQCGFGYEEHLNYLIGLDCTKDEVFNRIGARTRKHIRRALNKGEIVVDEVSDLGQIKTIYELIKKSYLEAHIPLASISLFEAAFEVLYPQKMIKFSLARIGDTYIASSVELLYKDIIYGWYGGVDRAFSNYTPTEVLTWRILEWGAENGYRTYDFGGAGSPREKYGVRDFKSKFGGDLVCFGRNTCVHDPVLLRLSTAGYNVFRHFIQK